MIDLTPRRKVLLEKLIAFSYSNFVFNGTRMLIAIVSQPNCEQCPDQIELFYVNRHIFLKINFNIILPYMPRS